MAMPARPNWDPEKALPTTQLADPNSVESREFAYGGQAGAGEADIRRFRNTADAAQQRAAVQANLAQDRQTRGVQSGLAQAYTAQMRGEGPSLAGYQMRRAVDQTTAAGMAGGVAPGAARAGAQRAAMLAASGATGAAATQAAQTSAAEQAAAADQYGGLLGAMRGADQQAALRQAELEMRQRQMNDARAQAYERAALQTADADMRANAARAEYRTDTNKAIAGAQNRWQDQSDKEESDMFDTVAAGASTAMKVFGLFSDARAKTDVADGAPAVRGMLGAIRPKTYDYVDGAGPSGRQLGVMAQDLERSPAGREIVEDTPRGKMIDVPRATGAALAGLADLNQRLVRLERRR